MNTGEQRIGGRSGRRLRLPCGATCVINRKRRTNGFVLKWKRPPGPLADLLIAAHALYQAKVAANNPASHLDMCGMDPKVNRAHRAMEEFLQAGHKFWGVGNDDSPEPARDENPEDCDRAE